MGGGPEHLLCVLPFPEPKELFERIRKHHPNIQITYRNLSHVDYDGVKEVPKGPGVYELSCPIQLRGTNIGIR